MEVIMKIVKISLVLLLVQGFNPVFSDEHSDLMGRPSFIGSITRECLNIVYDNPIATMMLLGVFYIASKNAVENVSNKQREVTPKRVEKRDLKQQLVSKENPVKTDKKQIVAQKPLKNDKKIEPQDRPKLIIPNKITKNKENNNKQTRIKPVTPGIPKKKTVKELVVQNKGLKRKSLQPKDIPNTSENKQKTRANAALKLLREREMEAFERIFKKYKFTNSEKNEFLETVKRLRDHEIPNFLKQKNNKKNWKITMDKDTTLPEIIKEQGSPVNIDSRIPSDIKKIIFELCAEFEIEPKNLNIGIDYRQSHELAYVYMGIWWNPVSKYSFLPEVTLMLNNSILGNDRDEIKRTLLHEFGHMFEGHPSIKCFLRNMLEKKSLSNVSDDLYEVYEYIADHRLIFERPEYEELVKNSLKPKKNGNQTIYLGGFEAYPAFLALQAEIDKRMNA